MDSSGGGEVIQNLNFSDRDRKNSARPCHVLAEQFRKSEFREPVAMAKSRKKLKSQAMLASPDEQMLVQQVAGQSQYHQLNFRSQKQTRHP